MYFGAVGWPARVPDHVSLWGSLLKFRREFDQYINLRPVRLFEGVPCPLAIYGKGIANPIAMIWSGGLMLDFLGKDPALQGDNRYAQAHDAILTVIEIVLAKGPRMPDLGDNASTGQLGRAIAELVRTVDVEHA